MLSHHLSRRALAGTAVAVASITLVACGTEQAADDPNPAPPGSSTTTAGDRPQPTTPPASEDGVTTIGVSLVGGDVVGGVRTEVVPLGGTVRIEVSGDTEEEVHVHTYDLFGDVSPDGPAVIEFVADIPGVHEVELEGSSRPVLELQVEP